MTTTASPYQFCIQPHGSLGNRLLCLLSCLRLARWLGMSPEIIWDRNFLANADFSDLFGASQPVVDKPPEPCLLFRRRTHQNIMLLPPLVNGTASVHVIHYYYVFRETEFDDAHQFIPALSAEFAALGLSDAVRARVERFDSIDFSNGIGVHLRRHVDPRFRYDVHYNRVSDDFYIAAIDYLRNSAGYAGPIFVASNVPASIAAVAERFPDIHALEHDGALPEAGPAAVQDALADIVLLSRCGIVLRNELTTFSRVSSIIGLRPQAMLSADGQSLRLSGPGG